MFTTAKPTYFSPPADGSRAFSHVNVDPATGEQPKNWNEDVRVVQIEDIRGKEHEFSLDISGFQYYRHPAKHTKFTNDKEIEESTIRKVSNSLRSLLAPVGWLSSTTKHQPFALVRIDLTPASSVARVHRRTCAASRSVPDHKLMASNLSFGSRLPLAVCDFRGLDTKEDLVPFALIYPDREGETYGVKYTPNHKWMYKGAMDLEDLVLLKCFDSLQDGSVATMAPHTAFEDPKTAL
ncbi:hypothetical protein EDD15DRAFT_2362372 [Pisolithus albus]|nr:hypothetical protein EDD15DRAFT_2362372 [Pisolithus albus]